MKKVTELTVEVTYRVEIGSLDMPDNVYEQIQESQNEGENINGDRHQYVDAMEWLGDNIRERDCISIEYEVEDIETEE